MVHPTGDKGTGRFQQDLHPAMWITDVLDAVLIAALKTGFFLENGKILSVPLCSIFVSIYTTAFI